MESETTSVIKVAREPAIIINGVPDLPSDCISILPAEVKNDVESQVDPRFGEWLQGRKVKKLFGSTYYLGKVVKYDSESNWYTIVYDDGDQEDLEWCELEELLLPLDITVPLKTLVLEKCKSQGTDHRRKVGRPRKVYARDDSVKKTSNLVPISQGNDTRSNELSPTSGQIVAVTTEGNPQQSLQTSYQPKKRGRPRKEQTQTASADNQPKKRGRPPKNHSSENTPGSTQQRKMTARAEKLKRENLRVQGSSPGTRLF
ncbi:hypothetical protein ACP4OV_019746 [Aristida adscensionis]